MKIYIVTCSSFDADGLGNDCYAYTTREEAREQIKRLHDLFVTDYESFEEEYVEYSYTDDYNEECDKFTMVMSDLLIDRVEIIEREI